MNNHWVNLPATGPYLLPDQKTNYPMDKKEQIEAYCRQFKITGLAAGLPGAVSVAERENLGYMEFIYRLFQAEAAHRQLRDTEKRRKAAGLPLKHNLDFYNNQTGNGLSPVRINQLRELNWLDGGFNIMLMGPSGTGKTFLAAGLCADAVEKGYKAYFRTMDQLLRVLKMKDAVRSAQAEHKRLLTADLIVIDDIMLFPVEKQMAVELFNFINAIYEQTCIIITTNKTAADWPKMLDDEVLATALLDRLLFHCEIIKLSGKSYRLKNRESFFDNQN